jgi:hypothetical protein
LRLDLVEQSLALAVIAVSSDKGAHGTRDKDERCGAKEKEVKGKKDKT